MPWPSATPGGAWSPYWGGYVKLWVRAGIAPGRAFHMGPDASDKLDDGNVLGGGELKPPPDGFPQGERLWVDLSCDILDLRLAGGAGAPDSIFTKSDASTLEVTLADPLAVYDPLNGNSPYAYGGHSRLVPGTPVECFVEVVDGDAGTVSTHQLFTGTADSWGEDWVPRASRREAKLTATDVTKTFVNLDLPDVPPVGAGDTVAERIARICTHYQWTGAVVGPATSTVTLGATAHAGSMWDQLNETLDNELGYVYAGPAGKLRWLNRSTWFTKSAPKLWLGCGAGAEGAYDVLLDASPSNMDAQIKNSVHAANDGGAVQAAVSTSSISKYGRYDLSRTDLGLASDAQAGLWAQDVLRIAAFPSVRLEDVTMRPALELADSWKVWRDFLALELVADVVRITWTPPDVPNAFTVDAQSRVVGYEHTVTRRSWETKLELVDAGALAFAGVAFTMGPHANDRLDAGFVLTM